MKHLKRLEQVFKAPPIYFITVCVANRRECLCDDMIHHILITEFSVSESKYAWNVGEYVIMPDHLHFICWPKEEAVSLSKFVGKWKEWSGKNLARYVSEFRWQAEFFDHVVRSEENVAEKRQYMRMNPVRAGLVSDEKEWPYRGLVSEM